MAVDTKYASKKVTGSGSGKGVGQTFEPGVWCYFPLRISVHSKVGQLKWALGNLKSMGGGFQQAGNGIQGKPQEGAPSKHWILEIRWSRSRQFLSMSEAQILIISFIPKIKLRSWIISTIFQIKDIQLKTGEEVHEQMRWIKTSRNNRYYKQTHRGF